MSLLWAQDSGGLRITVLAGESATNFVDTGRATAPVIQVVDAQGEPVAGAEVVFESPASGPSVTFFGATHRVALQTDQEGRAQPSLALPNTYEGPFSIEVSAAYNGLTAATTIEQTNAVAAPETKKKKFFTWRVIAGIAAAVTIVIVAIARSGDED